MPKLSSAILFCFGIGCAVPISATTTLLSGSFAAGDRIDLSGDVGLGEGLYRFTLEASVPLTDVMGEVEKITISEEFCDRNGDGMLLPCGSDSVPTLPLIEPSGPQTYSADLRVHPASIVVYSDASYSRFTDVCCTYRFSFAAPQTGTYQWSVAALPEPESWSLLVFGLALTGLSLRKNRRHPPLIS